MTQRSKRFFYVRAPFGRVMHIMYGRGHSEGPTKCGRQCSPGWRWMNRARTPICKRCNT
jgi:hypothetical protein